jgi:putative peptide zinc metalloprotease protein
LRIHNLQPRAFALGRTAMRKVLFGLVDPPPEQFTPALQRGLIAYAWATWVYRLFLFMGIALLVYHISFKLLGIFLAAVEVAFFIVKPIAAEVKEWIAMKQRIRQEGRWRGRGVVLAVVLAGVLLPLDSRVHVLAVLGMASEEQHFAPEPARVVQVRVAPRQAVSAGDVLLVLESPELDHAETLARLRLALVDQRLARIAGDDRDRANRAVLERERGLLLRELEGHALRRDRLVIRAGQAGTVTAVARGLAPGMWTGMKTRLVHVAGSAAVVARGVVNERDVARLGPDSAGTFVPDDPSLGTLDVSLNGIGTGTSAARELTLLASVNGGHVDASAGPHGELHTTAAMFPVMFSTVHPVPDSGQWPREIRGVVVASGERRSIARKVADRVVSVLLRETGF